MGSGLNQGKQWSTLLGVKWSQVQILSARPEKPSLTSVGEGFLVSRVGGAVGVLTHTR